MIRRPPRSPLSSSSAASDVYKRQVQIAPGVDMPLLGLGTGGGWAGNSTAVYQGTLSALSLGYRHFDTALSYGTLGAFGKAIKQAGVPRSELFITSKVPGGLTGSETTAAVNQSLTASGLEAVDLMLIHFPASFNGTGGENRVASWKALEEAVGQGLIRAIGVSHFCPEHIQEILKVSKVPVALNQVEYHVGMANSPDSKTDGRAFDQAHDITYESFMPLCGQCEDAELITGNVTNSIGAKYGKTGSQVALRWLVQQKIPAIPRSGSAVHQKQNLDIFDFELSQDDMGVLNAYSNSKIAGLSADCQIP
eukprot:TRINITY_DN722_c0_g1_i3.p1 TRINITY_DN722_c0_g1~~TRINITY_DN722_c0_g1_i3.p1  ORF type:complete len:308 (+),score=42.47 TRINITY_DN722_c0_g1_i3:99-1022(+)